MTKIKTLEKIRDEFIEKKIRNEVDLRMIARKTITNPDPVFKQQEVKAKQMLVICDEFILLLTEMIAEDGKEGQG